MGHNVVQSVENQPTFRRNMALISTGSKNNVQENRQHNVLCCRFSCTFDINDTQQDEKH
jgi:hypothetical protein